jgi:phage baseplate assembly protein W
MSRTIALPFHIDASGSVASETHPANQLTNRVFSVIATQPGSRIMRPAYGTDILQFVFGTGGKMTEIDGYLQGADAADMADVARAAITRYEPDAILDLLRITQMPDEDGVMRVEVMYRPTAGAAAANPNVVVRELVIGTLTDGTFSDNGVPNSRPTFWDRNAPEYSYQQDDDGVVDGSVFDAPWSTL